MLWPYILRNGPENRRKFLTHLRTGRRGHWELVMRVGERHKSPVIVWLLKVQNHRKCHVTGANDDSAQRDDNTSASPAQPGNGN